MEVTLEPTMEEKLNQYEYIDRQLRGIYDKAHSNEPLLDSDVENYCKLLIEQSKLTGVVFEHFNQMQKEAEQDYIALSETSPGQFSLNPTDND